MILTVYYKAKSFLIKAKPGEKIKDLLQQEGVGYFFPCGGNGKCGKCKARLVSGSIADSAVEADGFFRLCSARVREEDCCIELTGFDLPTGVLSKLQKNGSFQTETGYGVAVDIGTTTVELVLINLATAEPMESRVFMNPQAEYGADVISRISSCEDKANIERQQRALLAALKNEIESMVSKTEEDKIKRIVVSGNTTMLHLFKGADPTLLGKAPFKTAITGFLEMSPEELSQDVLLPAGQIIMLPPVSAYIGADVVADILSVETGEAAKKGEKFSYLAIDLGTNGEMVIKKEGRFFCASTAAGPALEGVGIECGIGGVRGALCKLNKLHPLSFEVIGNGKATGLCGSGLVDLVAQLREENSIDENGTLQTGKYELTDELWLSQKDVRQIQLTKSAIISGIETLCEEASAKPADLDCVYIFGGMGTHLDLKNACKAGVLPEVCIEKAEKLGNGSLQGAYLVLTNMDLLKESDRLSQKMEVIDLAQNEKFAERFIENIAFPGNP